MAGLSKWEALRQKTDETFFGVLTRLNKIWEEIGYTEERRLNHGEQAYCHIKELLDDMISEAERSKQLLLEKIQEMMKEISEMSKELGTTVDTTEYVDLPLEKVEQMLCAELRELRHLQEQRVETFQRLLAEEESICKILGAQPIDMKEQLLSEEKLKSFTLYLEEQRAKVDRLESEFHNTRESILQMMDDLDVRPSSQFDFMICRCPERFEINVNNMTKLNELHDRLKVQVQESKERVKEMKEELIKLWRCFGEPEHACEKFLNDNVGINSRVIEMLDAELKRCKEKKQQNMSKYIAHVRSELEKLWDLCRYSESEKLKFIHFHSDTYTEDLLTLHELEVKKLQEFYDVNRPIFEKIDEHKNLVTRMNELMKRANDPNRFHNRGGQLLAEEKERKIIQKQLPKIEEQLRNLTREYETTHGETFTADGITVDEMLEKLWDGLNEERKKAKQETKDKSAKKGTLNSSKKTTFNASRRTPGVLCKRPNSTKRMLVSNPSPSGSTKRKNLSIAGESKTRKKEKVSRRLLYSSKKKAVENDLQKENENLPCSSNALNTTYDKFKAHLNNPELCSSLLPEEVLMNVTTSTTDTFVTTRPALLAKNARLPIIPHTTLKSTKSGSAQKVSQNPDALPTARLTTATPLSIIL